MKKINSLLNDYAKTLEEIETLKKDRAAAVQAAATGKSDVKSVSKIKDADIRLEVANVTLGNIKAALIDQIGPEYQTKKDSLSAELSKLTTEKQDRYNEYLKLIAAAIVCRESITGNGRFDVLPGGDVKENALPAMSEPFLPGTTLNLDERNIYAAAVADERKKYTNEPFNRKAADIRSEISEIEKILQKDPETVADKLIQKGA